MGWFRKFFGSRKEGNAAPAPKARWLEPSDPGNPFGVRLLDLMANLQMISTTEDPEIAARSMSWQPGVQRRVSIEVEGTTHPCDLRYPAAAELPDGLLYRPDQMEDKWVVAYREGRLAAARSWTGETKVVADAEHVGETLRLTRVTLAADSGFDVFGDPLRGFDWFMRTHALGARIPFPVSEALAQGLADHPLQGFSLFGRQLFCAAVDFEPEEPSGCLYSDGDLAGAVASGERSRVDAALAAGQPINAPCRFNHGARALHLAILLHPHLIDPLLDAGADVNAATAMGSSPLMAAASINAGEIITRLIDAGANPNAADTLGFCALHVAAQFGCVAALNVLVAHGADLAARTKRGMMPIHVAAGLGQREVIEWLISKGVDPNTPSPSGDALAIAEQEGHQELARLLS